MDGQSPEAHEKLSPFQLLIFVLSVLALVAVGVDAVARMPAAVSVILQYFDTSVCLFLLLDFCIRFKRAESKLAFMKWGWIDLLASIPNLDFLRVGRMVRILRILRLLRTIRAGQRIWALLLQNKVKSAAASVVLTTLLFLTFSSMAILAIEDGPSSNIKTAEDAIWWSVSTITTVGYGDKFPTTTEGRIIAMVLMFAGVGLFGTLSGIIASSFVGRTGRETQIEKTILAELVTIKAKLEEIDRMTQAHPEKQNTQRMGGREVAAPQTQPRSSP